MNITSTQTPRHTKEEAKADAVALQASKGNADNNTARVHTAVSVRPEIMEEGQFTGYIITRP